MKHTIIYQRAELDKMGVSKCPNHPLYSAMRSSVNLRFFCSDCGTELYPSEEGRND
jgi:hypothetical protein